MRPRLLAVWLCLLIAAPLASCGSGSGGDKPAKPPRSTFVGMVSGDVFAGAPAYANGTLAQQASMRVDILRQTFDWAALEPARGRLRFAATDRFVAEAAQHGIAVLPILFHPPAWATGNQPRAQTNTTYPPRRPADMAAFARTLVTRYGPRGSLWRAHPDVPKVPIENWQVWNEPNLPQYWGNKPDAKAYAKLLAGVSAGIHGADPGARVLTAGFPNSKLGVPFTTYVKAFYAAGARPSFDILALHPYSSSAEGTLQAVVRARSLMRRYGDARKPVWVTEMGWASAGPPSPFTFDPLSQAQLVGNSIQLLAAKRRALRIAGFVYFGWKDGRPYSGRSDYWGLNTGLLEVDGTAKPSLAAFRDAVRRATR